MTAASERFMPLHAAQEDSDVFVKGEPKAAPSPRRNVVVGSARTKTKAHSTKKGLIKTVEDQKPHSSPLSPKLNSEALSSANELVPTSSSTTTPLDDIGTSGTVVTPPVKGFVYVAIDGDACLFHPNLISRGREGGWKAAEILVRELQAIFSFGASQDVDIVTQIFVRYGGMANFVWRRHRISEPILAAFLNGFGEADPLFNVMTVGSAKEASDAKVKGGLRFHIGLAGCRYVALAGLADAGYAPMIRQFITRGYRDKLVLLKTSEVVSWEMNQLIQSEPQTIAEATNMYRVRTLNLPPDLFVQGESVDSKPDANNKSERLLLSESATLAVPI